MVENIFRDALDAAFPLSRLVRLLVVNGPDWGWYRLMMGVAWLFSLLLNLALYVALVVVALALAAAVLGWPFVSAFFIDRVRGWMSSPWARLVATAVLVLLGLALYWLKTRVQSIYGGAEMLLGGASCWTGLERLGREAPAPKLAAAIVLSGGVYLIVKGLENFTKGLPRDEAPVRLT